MHADFFKITFFEKFIQEYHPIGKHAKLRTKTITLRPTYPWFTEELHAAKHTRRKLERKWRNSGLVIDHEIYRQYCAETNKRLKQLGKNFHQKNWNHAD